MDELERDLGLHGCISKFEKQFKTKTGNNWFSRDNFVRKPNKYYLTEKHIPMDDKEIVKEENVTDDINLNPKVISFLKLVTNVDMLNKTLVSLNIDPKKMPLGAISSSQLDKADTVLTQITKLFDEKNIEEKIVELSSEFYTYFPYSCGRLTKPPIIDNKELVDKFHENIDDLKNLKIAYTTVKQGKSIDSVYKSLNTTIQPLDDGDMRKAIEKYVETTVGSTHLSMCQISIVDIYEIERDDHSKKNTSIGNTMLLWHGTRLSNYVSILQKGLLLNPEIIHGTFVSGKMFGYGIYSADSFSKSFNYCGCYSPGEEACLFLAEVDLGTPSKRIQSDYYITKDSLAKEGCQSTWGQGKVTVSGCDEVNGVKVPYGPLIDSNVDGAYLQYNEFIVYDTDQLRLKYIVRVKRM